MQVLSVLVAQSCLTLCDSLDCISPGSSVLGILQARILDGSHALLQEILLTQELNPGLLCCRQILYHLSHQRSPTQYIQYLFSVPILLKIPQIWLLGIPSIWLLCHFDMLSSFSEYFFIFLEL